MLRFLNARNELYINFAFSEKSKEINEAELSRKDRGSYNWATRKKPRGKGVCPVGWWQPWPAEPPQ